MREIKFRFWSNHLGKFVTPDDSIFAGALKDPDMNVMQFTGLKDKNGVEIFEGDIVRSLDGWGNEKTSRVLWGDQEEENPSVYPAFDLEPRIDEELNSFAYAFISGDVELQVIGNIYENPELLKTGKQ